MKIIAAFSAFIVSASSANAMSLVSLHGAPVTISSSATNILIGVAGLSLLAALAAFRLRKD